MTTHPGCGTVVYVILLPTSHLYTTCGVPAELPACGLACAGAIAAAMHSAKTMTIDLTLPSMPMNPAGSCNLCVRLGLIPSGSDCFLCTQDALHGRMTIGHGFHS